VNNPDLLLADLDSFAQEVEAFSPETARSIRETARRASEAFAAWWNQPLAVAEASAWGGYSESQLRRLIKEGVVPSTEDGGIRRRDVPTQPGHRLPLEIEPTPDMSGIPLASRVHRIEQRRRHA
jgi:hypothetical protein